MSDTLTLDDLRRLETPSAPSPAADTPSGGKSYGFAPSVVMLREPSSPRSDAIRALRTHVMAQHLNLGRRALAICGASQGVGCSFTATNLAVSLSQIGVKTLLVDGDLRRPTIDKLIRPQVPVEGLTECLRSVSAPFSRFIDVGALPNLSIIYAGAGMANPQELLGGDRFAALMQFCLRDFDITIVDTPPANTSTDARLIGGAVGYGLIVAAKNKTFVKDVKTLIDELRADGCHTIGSVLNRG